MSRNLATDELDEVLSNRVGIMLCCVGLKPSFWRNRRYYVFPAEILHLFCIGTSEILKKCIVFYVSSPEVKTNSLPPLEYRSKLLPCKNRLRDGCNNLLRACENNFQVSRLQTDFSKRQTTSTLNELFAAMGVKGMLEGKNSGH